MISGEVSTLFVSIILGYYAGKGHRPKWMAFGNKKKEVNIPNNFPCNFCIPSRTFYHINLLFTNDITTHNIRTRSGCISVNH